MPKIVFSTSVTGPGVKDLKDQVDKLGDEAKETTKEMKALDRAAERVAKGNLTAQERYNKKIADLDRLVKTGRLSTDQAAMAAKRYGEQLQRAGNRGKSAFGPQMLSQVKAFAGGLLSVAAAATTLINEFSRFKEIADSAREDFRGGLGSIGQLGQLAQTQQQFDASVAMATRLRDAGIFETTDAAARTAFSLISGGLSSAEVDKLIQLGERRFFGSGEEFRRTVVAGTLLSEEGLTPSQALSMATEAASIAVGFGVADVANRAARLSPVGQLIGANTAELQAAIGVLGGPGKIAQAEQAETAIKAFLSIASREGIGGGGGLLAAVQAAQALTPEEFKQTFGGSTEAVAGGSILIGNLELFEERITKVNDAVDKNLAAERSAFIQQNEETAASMRVTAARAELSGLQRDERQVMLDTIEARKIENDIIRARNGLTLGEAATSAGESAAISALTTLGGDEIATEMQNQGFWQWVFSLAPNAGGSFMSGALRGMEPPPQPTTGAAE